MGTLVNGLEHVYRTILQAMGQLSEIQVVLSVGQNVKREALGTIPSNVIVVRRAPQIELLKRAALCITHAGLNTTLESLGQGVPMVAIPSDMTNRVLPLVSHTTAWVNSWKSKIWR